MISIVSSEVVTVYPEGKIIQSNLKRMNITAGGTPDGKFWNDTETAVRLFQEHYELPKNMTRLHEFPRPLTADGVVGKNTLLTMDEALVRGWRYERRSYAHSEFGNLIAKYESSDSYEICNRINDDRTKSVIRNVAITKMPLNDVMSKQSKRELFAVGRYQVIPDVLKEAVRVLKLDKKSNFDETMQDRIFDEYLISIKRPPIIKYLEGSGSIEDAMYYSAMEWASIGVQKGQVISKKRIAKGGESYYADDGLNKAHIKPEQIKNALESSKMKK